MHPSDDPIVFTGMEPILAVSNLERAVAHYANVLGFTVGWRWGEPPVRAGVERDGLALQLVADGRGAPEGPSYVYFQVRGVDAYFAACVANGAEVVMPLADRPFGMRDFRVQDPSGNTLGFAEPLPGAK